MEQRDGSQYACIERMCEELVNARTPIEMLSAINDVNGKRRVKTFKLKADAEDWLAEQRRARSAG